jgi:hypothetical protein
MLISSSQIRLIFSRDMLGAFLSFVFCFCCLLWLKSFSFPLPMPAHCHTGFSQYFFSLCCRRRMGSEAGTNDSIKRVVSFPLFLFLSCCMYILPYRIPGLEADRGRHLLLPCPQRERLCDIRLMAAGSAATPADGENVNYKIRGRGETG